MLRSHSVEMKWGQLRYSEVMIRTLLASVGAAGQPAAHYVHIRDSVKCRSVARCTSGLVSECSVFPGGSMDWPRRQCEARGTTSIQRRSKHFTPTLAFVSGFSSNRQQRRASAVLAMGRCLSVCLSVTSQYCINTAELSKVLFSIEASSTYPALCYNAQTPLI